MDVSNRKSKHARRGSALIYVAILAPVLFGIGALAVDAGRIYAAKAELQSATDAAARYAATAMRSQMSNTSAAGANASAVFAQNIADGAVVGFNPSTDMTLGIWTPATKTFVPATLAAGANAVRLQTKMTLGDAARPLTFASVLGKKATIHANATVMVNARTGTTPVSSKGNPWLSGMPNGSVSKSFRTNASEWDYAGTGANDASSPAMLSMSALSISPGATILFDGVTGAADFGGGTAVGDADGDGTRVVTLGSPTFNNYTYFTSPMNGMSNIKAPINSMMAVFLSDDVPTSGSTPSPLDFSTASSRDFTSLSPQLKQVFFVGDGRRSNGEAQQFVVPAGATRLFIGNMDGWQWNNNSGGYNATINSTTSVSTVK
jgi:Flp pilus assembly protein TadG